MADKTKPELEAEIETLTRNLQAAQVACNQKESECFALERRSGTLLDIVRDLSKAVCKG